LDRIAVTFGSRNDKVERIVLTVGF